MADDVSLKIGGDSKALVDALKQGGDAFTKFVSKASSDSESLNKKLHEISGGDLLREANQYAEAVQHIGGASKLTADEKVKLNAQLSAALEKYKALGQQAPAALQQLAKDTEQAGRTTTRFASEVESAKAKFGLYVASFFTAQAAFAAAATAGRMVVDFLSDSIKEATEAEAVHKKLTAAINAQGLAVPGLADQYDELAGKFQETTIHADDLIKEMQALLIQVGGAMPDQMEGALKAATNLSAGLGIDLRTATMAVGKAMAGEVDSLKRYGIEIDETAAAAHGAGVIFESVNAKFGGQAQAQVDSYAGKLTQLKNTYADLKEEVGRSILNHGLFQLAVEGVKKAIDDLTATGKRADQSVLGDMARAFLDPTGLLGAADAISKRLLARKEDIVLTEQGAKVQAAANKVATDYAAILKDTREKVAALTPEQKAQIAAAEKLHISHEDLNKELKVGIPVIAMYVEKTRDAATATRKAHDEGVIWGDGLSVTDKTLVQFGIDLLALEESGRRAGLGMNLSLDTMLKLGAFGPIVSRELESVNLGLRMLEGRNFGLPTTPREHKPFDPTLMPDVTTWGDTVNGWAAQLPGQIARAFEGGGGWKGALQAGGSTLGADLMKKLFNKDGGFMKDLPGFASSLLSGAAPIIGALAGPLIGKIAEAFKKTEHLEIAKDIGRQWGTSITDELAKQIEKDAKEKFGKDRVAGSLFNLDSIIAGDGGLADGNLEKYTRKLRDVFSMIETGKFKAADAAKVLDANWSAFVTAHTDGNGRVSESLKEIIALADRFSVKSKEIAAWQQGQGAAAIAGFNAIVAGSAMTSREELANLETQALATFNAAVKAGMGEAAALQQLGPSLDAIRAKWKALGIESDNAAFRALDTQRAIAQGNPALMSAVDGLKQQMVALSNLNALDAESFAAMGQTAALMYARLQSEAEKLGKTGAEGTKAALGPMQGYLQQAAAQARELGIPLDQNTEMLIEQSKQLGIWKDLGPTAAERTADAMQHAADAIDRVAAGLERSLGLFGQMASAAAGVAGAMGSGEFGQGPGGVIAEPGFDTGGTRTPVGHRGGLVMRGQILHDGGPVVKRGVDRGDVPALLQRGEYVLNRDAVNAAGLPLLRSMNRERTPEGMAAAIARANAARANFGGSAGFVDRAPFVGAGTSAPLDVAGLEQRLDRVIAAIESQQGVSVVNHISSTVNEAGNAKQTAKAVLQEINAGGELYGGFQRLAKGAVRS